MMLISRYFKANLLSDADFKAFLVILLSAADLLLSDADFGDSEVILSDAEFGQFNVNLMLIL